ncbi:MAG: cyclohexa-1,5-dienecarbonyl-CoA hydratase [Alphaproteobacteria bacterium]|nr:cyclohexa-1,5-dienecarbonyl-CoA hydratase [Alphaproteobacteria bacterium]
MTAPLKVWLDRDGRLLRLRLDRPPANIIDAAMIGALAGALDEHLGNDGLAAVVLDAEGPHFSFGASIEEHLPADCAAMLHALHGLVLNMSASPIPILVAVQGQCLGGGLEVALAGHLMFVAPDAKLGQPEIRVGVFAPAASCLLPERAPRVVAEAMLLSGQSIDGDAAVRHGIANEVAAAPSDAALKWFDDNLAPLSASSLRHAVRAARVGYTERLAENIARVETLYLDSLMATRDAVAGLEAFLDKRPANWEHR